MNTKKFLRVTGVLMLIIAVIFVIVALGAPQFRRVFYIGGFKVDANVKRIFYLLYLIVAVTLLIASFVIKDKADK